VASLEGVTTLYNTYWVRFAHGRIDHELAVANSRTLFHAAKRAGVQRIVHVSITHPSVDSPWPYFRGKALVERALAEAEVPYAVLRPAILFGGDGVLLNNIAWLLRHLPVFAVGGRGDYRIRGIHVDDLAQLCVRKGAERHDSVTDAVGPERPTFVELVTSIRDVIGSHARIVHVPGVAVPLLSRLVGLALHDVLLTRDEYGAMAAGLADTKGRRPGRRPSRSGWWRTATTWGAAMPTSSSGTSDAAGPRRSPLGQAGGSVEGSGPRGIGPGPGDLEESGLLGDDGDGVPEAEGGVTLSVPGPSPVP
jgi:uncharacterized protein YbjT (DUF2867 family)